MLLLAAVPVAKRVRRRRSSPRRGCAVVFAIAVAALWTLPHQPSPLGLFCCRVRRRSCSITSTTVLVLQDRKEREEEEEEEEEEQGGTEREGRTEWVALLHRISGRRGFRGSLLQASHL